MTKALSDKEKKERKQKRKQQKAASKTVVKVTQPKHEDPPAEPVNLCDDCAYEFGECEGKPKFADRLEEGLTGAEADRVVECPAFRNVAEMPTADQARKEAAAQDPVVKLGGNIESTGNALQPPQVSTSEPEIIIVCSGGCGKTTEGMTSETMSGEFKDFEEGQVPEWTCQDCLDKAAAESGEEAKPEDQVIRKDLPIRPDPKRFQAEEDFGTCPSCDKPLKRTALNRYQDAIRCTNGRCRAYRNVVKTVSTGVK